MLYKFVHYVRNCKFILIEMLDLKNFFLSLQMTSKSCEIFRIDIDIYISAAPLSTVNQQVLPYLSSKYRGWVDLQELHSFLYNMSAYFS